MYVWVSEIIPIRFKGYKDYVLKLRISTKKPELQIKLNCITCDGDELFSLLILPCLIDAQYSSDELTGEELKQSWRK